MVPTLVNIDNFPKYADQGEARFPRYAAHMRALHARRHENVRTAFESGVPISPVPTPVGSRHTGSWPARCWNSSAGVPAADAVGAGSWRARAYLLGIRRVDERCRRGPDGLRRRPRGRAGGAAPPGADHPARPRRPPESLASSLGRSVTDMIERSRGEARG